MVVKNHLHSSSDVQKVVSRTLTLLQPGSGKSVNYRGPFSFDLAFMRCKLTSLAIWQVCNRALQF
jgi:hypothetical protein